MQYAKCIKSNVQGSLAEKLLAQLISRHSPDFVFFFSFLYTDLFNVILTLYFLQTEMLPAAQKKKSMNTKKVLIPSIWKPFKNRHRFMFFYMCLLFYLWHVYCFVLIFCVFIFYFVWLILFYLFIRFFTSCLWLLFIYYICIFFLPYLWFCFLF